MPFHPLLGQIVREPREVWLLVAGGWLFLVFCNLIVARPQQKEAAGSLWRLCWVCAALAGLEALPLIVAAALSEQNHLSGHEQSLALGSTLFGMFAGYALLMPPVRLRGTKEKLPRVTDETFLARVAALAAQMGLATPLVRLWPSVTGSQQAFAFAGTLQAPQLVVTDGIMHRLEPAERDAVIAHELGHIANGSLWLYAAVVPVSCALMVAVSPRLPLNVAIPFGIAFLVGLRRLITRPTEFDCDRRAARAIGFRQTAAALTKIHAVNPTRNSGLLSLLVFATSTHPSRDARLAALYRHAPPDDRPEPAPDEARMRNYRWTACAALAIWALVLAGTLLTAFLGDVDGLLAVPLWIVGLTPLSLLTLALRKRASRAQRRMGSRWRLVRLIGLGLALGMAVVLVMVPMVLMDFDRPENGAAFSWILSSVSSMACLFGMSIWVLVTNRKRKLVQNVAVALQVHDFRRALDLCAAAPKVVRRSHLLRYNQAIAQAVCGNREAAIDALERLWSDKPRFPLSALALCELLLETGGPERVIEVAGSVAPRLPDDPAPPFHEARALRQLRRIEEAQAACNRALAIDPEAAVIALQVGILLDRGETEQAKTLIDAALEKGPGEPYVLIVRAEVAIESEPLEAARSAVAAAARSVAASPLSFMTTQIRRLESRLDKRTAPRVAEGIFVE